MRGVAGTLMIMAACATSAAGCATSSANPDAGIDGRQVPDAFRPKDAPIPDAGPPADSQPAGPGFFVDQDVADFTGTLESAVVSDWGGIEPVAYFTGGLLAQASDDQTVTSGAAAAWLDFQNMTKTNTVTALTGLDLNWGAATPLGLGLTTGETWTIGVEGEIYLEPGSWSFHLLCDDHGFIEIAQPGSPNYSRVTSSDGSETTGAFVATTEAWHPIRILISEDTGNAYLRLLATPPGGSRGAIAASRLRARADNVRGLAFASFDDAYMLGPSSITIDTAAPASYDWGTGSPSDVGLTSSDNFTTRWVGQLRVDTPGSYVYRYVSDDGQRLWIDGDLILDDWDATSHDNMTSSLTLTAGWHDIAIDHMETTTSARATLSIASGPEDAGGALPLAKLRPVVPRRHRFAAGYNRSDYSVADLGSADSTVVLDAPAGAKVGSLVVSYTFDHAYHGDVEIRLIGPDGANVLLRDNSGGAASGSVSERFAVTQLSGAAVAGTWTLRMSDTASLHTGALRDFQITVHHTAGSPPIATAAAYTSDIKDLGGQLSRYDQISWGARVPGGAQIQVRVRSADTAQQLDQVEWSTPFFDPDGSSLSGIPAKRYFQYRIEFTSDGDAAPAVDWVRLDYTADDAS